MTPTVLVATWHDGLFSVIGKTARQELAGRSLCRRSSDGGVLGVRDVLEPLPGFDETPGRGQWHAGTALVDGRLVGPPLGVRSMSATCDGAALFANVHVGGIPRSVDGGATWHSTIDINADVPRYSHIP